MKNQSLAFLENVATFDPVITTNDKCSTNLKQILKPPANRYPIRLITLSLTLSFVAQGVFCLTSMQTTNGKNLSQGTDQPKSNQLWDRIQEQSELIQILKTKMDSQKRLIEFYVRNPRKEDLSWN